MKTKTGKIQAAIFTYPRLLLNKTAKSGNRCLIFPSPGVHATLFIPASNKIHYC